MKKIFFIIFALTNSLPAAFDTKKLVENCDLQFALNTRKVLVQMSGFSTPKALRDYQDYMIATKVFEDLNFKIHRLEIKLPMVTLAQLRTPLQKYNDCRNQRVELPKTLNASLCDNTYAAYMQRVLSQLSRTYAPAMVEKFKEHMILLKQFEDTRFKIQGYEHFISLPLISTLRSPTTWYLGCRDFIIRDMSQVVQNKG